MCVGGRAAQRGHDQLDRSHVENFTIRRQIPMEDASRFLKATSNGDLEECKEMFNAYSDGHKRRALANLLTKDRESSVIMLAIKYEYPNLVRLLLSHGADPNFRSAKGTSPLTVALCSNRPYIIRLITKSYLRQEFVAKDHFLSDLEIREIFSRSVERKTIRDVLVDVYAAQLPDDLVVGIASGFLRTPTRTLLDVLTMAKATENKAMRLKATEPFTSDELQTGSNRLQMAAAACLSSIGALKDGLGRFECDELLRAPSGREALELALRYRLRVFCAQPEVQGFMRREWRGKLLDHALDGALPPAFRARSACYFSLACAGNICFLWLVAVLPQLESLIFDVLVAFDHSSRRRSVDVSESSSVLAFSWLDYFLFRTPCFKFWARFAADTQAAVAITLLRFDAQPSNDEWLALRASEPFHVVMTLWAVAGLLAELQQFAPSVQHLRDEIVSFVQPNVPSVYRANVFNTVDMLTWLLLLLALMQRANDVEAALMLSSLAAVAAWCRLLRVLTLSSTLGPLVLMFVKMAHDVAQLLVILSFVVLMFTSGFYVLLQAHPHDGASGLTLSAGNECNAFFAMRGRLDRWDRLLFVFGNGAISSETHMTCLMAELPQHWLLAWLYVFLFNVLTAVLLLNMLIAMMAKTFDNVWEASEVNHQFLFARLVRSQQTRPPEPPPLTLLRAPVTILAVSLVALSALLPRASRAHALVNRAKVVVLSGFEYSSFLNIARELERRKRRHEDMRESKRESSILNSYAKRTSQTSVIGDSSAEEERPKDKPPRAKQHAVAAVMEASDKSGERPNRNSLTFAPKPAYGADAAADSKLELTKTAGAGQSQPREPSCQASAGCEMPGGGCSRQNSTDTRLFSQPVMSVQTSAGGESATRPKWRGFSIVRQATEEAAANVGLDGEYIGTNHQKRNTFEAWRASMTREELCERCADFILGHENNVAHEQRWRSKMMKRIDKMLHETEERLVKRLVKHLAEGPTGRSVEAVAPSGDVEEEEEDKEPLAA